MADNEPSRSGTIELPVGTLGALVPTHWYPVCSIGNLAQLKTAPRSVRVRVAKESWQEPLLQASLFAGVWWEPEASYSAWIGGAHPYCGVIRFEYGSKGLQRSIYCDLRSGEYQVPPCEFLRVSATRYTPAVDVEGEFPYTVDRTSFQIEGEIADGVAADFTPMVFTAPSDFGAVAAGEYVRVAAPPGAYAFEIYPNNPDPDFTGNRFVTKNPASVRDFVDGAWFPPNSPLPLLESYVEVASDNPSVRECKLVFFVR